MRERLKRLANPAAVLFRPDLRELGCERCRRCRSFGPGRRYGSGRMSKLGGASEKLDSGLFGLLKLNVDHEDDAPGSGFLRREMSLLHNPIATFQGEAVVVSRVLRESHSSPHRSVRQNDVVELAGHCCLLHLRTEPAASVLVDLCGRDLRIGVGVDTGHASTNTMTAEEAHHVDDLALLREAARRGTCRTRPLLATSPSRRARR
jgi:hypothetical protein